MVSWTHFFQSFMRSLWSTLPCSSLWRSSMSAYLLCARVVYAWQFDDSIYLSEGRKRAAVILMLKISLIPLVSVISILLTYENITLAYYMWALMLVIIFV